MLWAEDCRRMLSGFRSQRWADALNVWGWLHAKCRLNLAAVEAIIVLELIHHFLTGGRGLIAPLRFEWVRQYLSLLLRR